MLCLKIKIKLFLIVSVLLIFTTARLRCPIDVRSDYVKDKFDLNTLADGKMTYEIGYKDATQLRIFDLNCITGRKTLTNDTEHGLILHDDFNIGVKGTNVYRTDLQFKFKHQNGTDVPRGYMIGKWSDDYFNWILDKIEFPNQVVDVGVRQYPNGTIYYQWIVEFQCIEVFDYVAFYAFNFYSKSNNSEEDFKEMNQTAYKHGLGPFIEAWPFPSIKKVDHTACWYENMNNTYLNNTSSLTSSNYKFLIDS